MQENRGRTSTSPKTLTPSRLMKRIMRMMIEIQIAGLYFLWSQYWMAVTAATMLLGVTIRYCKG